VDEDGTYLTPLGVPPNLTLARVTPGGVVTSLLPTPVSAGGTVGRSIDKDIVSGDSLVLDAVLYRVSQGGAVGVVSSMVWSMYNFGLASDARTGDVLIGQQDLVLKMNPVQGQATTLATRNIGTLFTGIVYERRSDTWAATTMSGDTEVCRITRSGVVTSLLRPSGSNGIVSYGSRNVSANASPRVGAVFTLNFSELAAPNTPYLAAASMASFPGIPTAAGTIDLRPDPLMALSLASPAMFRGFVGQLNATGAAVGSIAVPSVSGLRGTRFFVSFVTLGGAGIQTIANTAGFTIR
jgi:hypothetical protein